MKDVRYGEGSEGTEVTRGEQGKLGIELARDDHRHLRYLGAKPGDAGGLGGALNGRE